MSGILKKVGKRKAACAAVLTVGALCFFAGLYVVGALVIAALWLNEAAVRRIRAQLEPFGARSRVRNVDYLLIGDMCRPEDIVPAGKSYVQIAAPGRSLAACYEILRHTHSILKEDGGCAVLAVQDKNSDKKSYSVFDVSFFHTVTVTKLCLERLSKWRSFPVLLAPWRTMRFLIGWKRDGWHRAACPDRGIERFCVERNIELRYMCG